MNKVFGNNKDNLIAVATLEDSEDSVLPVVRTVDAYYENGAFYVVTHAKSNKIVQIEKHPEIAVAGC